MDAIANEILGLPNDGRLFREWWQELTGRKAGTPLVPRLARAVATGALADLTERIEADCIEAFRLFGGSDGFRRAITCARLATVDPGDAAAVKRLLEGLGFTLLPAETAPTEPAHWSSWLRDVIDDSPEGSLFRPGNSEFSPAMAWHLVTRFWAELPDRAQWGRRALSTKTLVVLLVDRRLQKTDTGKSEYAEAGTTAELKLELLTSGRGHVYADPETLLFVQQDESFRAALTSARAGMRELLDGDLQGHDVCWSLRRHDDGQAFTELFRDSAGAAFALGLAAIWARTPDKPLARKLRGLDLRRVGVTARLEKDADCWRLADVAGVPEKVWAAAQRSAQVQVVCVASGQARSTFPNLRVVEASTLRDLVEKLYREPKERSGPRWSWRTLGIAALCAVALIIPIVKILEGSARRRQAKLDLARWHEKAPVSLLPSLYSEKELTALYALSTDDPLDLARGLIHRRDFEAAGRALQDASARGLSNLVRFHTLQGDLCYFQNQFENALPHYEQAALQAGPDDVDTQSDLALALEQSQAEDAPAKIERALRIRRHILALLDSGTSRRPSKEQRQKWACAHLSLAKLLIDRPRYKFRSVEAGIRSIQQSLTVFTERTDEGAWAAISSYLGVSYQNRLDGDRTDNLNHSIQALQGALAVFERQENPRKISYNRYMLGVAWAQLRAGDRAANVERALELFRLADERLGDLASKYPADTARIQRWRGLALIDRRQGSRKQNLEDAIACFESALTVFDRRKLGIDAAKTKTDLGRALLLRSRTTGRDDVETAIAYLREAAGVLTQEKFEVEWSQVQTDLGAAYRERLAGDRAANLRESSSCYRGALSVRARSGRADRLATTLNGLARTMRELAALDGDGTLTTAVSLLHDALALLPDAGQYRHDPLSPNDAHKHARCRLSPAEAPEYLAETSSNLGDVWSVLSAGRSPYLREIAAECYRSAAQFYAMSPYYLPEYSTTLRKLELLCGDAALSGRPESVRVLRLTAARRAGRAARP